MSSFDTKYNIWELRALSPIALAIAFHHSEAQYFQLVLRMHKPTISHGLASTISASSYYHQ